MTEISRERIERFWKWCGLRKDGNFWYDPKGKQLSEELLPLDLNNLFRWAVPKVLEKIGRESLVALVNNALCDAIEAKGDVQDYLFLLIEELIEEE